MLRRCGSTGSARPFSPRCPRWPSSTGSVNLGQGFPDTDGPIEVAEAAVAAIRAGVNQYPPGPGHPDLRLAIAEHQQRFYGLELDPATEVVVTTGATEAVAAALLGLVDPGDEVVALEPFYDSYAACIEMAGGVRVPVTLRAPDFRLDLDRLRAAVTDRDPADPAQHARTTRPARCSPRDELAAVADLAVERDLVVVTDEVYEHLTYDVAHLPARHVPRHARSAPLTISSAGKTFSFTGWKIGWATGPAAPGARGADGQAVPHLRVRRAVPARGRRRRCGCRTPTSTSCARRCAASATGCAPGCARSGFDVFGPQGTYFVTADVRPLG